jgi:predicted Zn finger-like uncharacterized protein
MITHCPSCHTHFRVHAEQLTARGGQVRCGKCSRVFDALEHLIEEAGPARERSAAQDEYALMHAADAVAAPQAVPAETADVGADVHEPVAAASIDVEAEPMLAASEMFKPAIPEPASARPASAEAWTASGANSFDFGPIAAAGPTKHARRWPWLLGAVLLLAVLLAQAAYYYRSAVIVLFPETKPYAAALCATLRCDLPLPRRIELMSIEASDLQADTTNPNIMVLSATLKNRAIFDQQLPLLELTLTDAQDQPVVRRVLAPQDYIGKAANTQAGFGANTEIAIKVFFEGSQVKATGYRLYLFYP